jgi:hypothetical protein
MMLRARRKKDGTVTVSLGPDEACLLRALPARLRAILERADVADRVLKRLFPPAYRDAKKEAEYKELLGRDLLRRKLESVDTFEKTLKNWTVHKDHVTVTIRPVEYDLWLGFVNDMRLVLGTELDIQDDNWSSTFNPFHPQAEDMALLHYLSWLEEQLLGASAF